MLGFVALGALAVIVILRLAGKHSQGDPARLAALFRQYGKQAAGIALLAFSGFAATRDNWMPAVVLAPIGLGLLQMGAFTMNGFGLRQQRLSRLHSAYFEMTLDQASGALSGKVIAGAFAGSELASLEKAALLRLRVEVSGDPDSLNLIEAYLDRRLPSWREHVNEGAGARQGGARAAQALSKQEAYQILGLQPGAGPDTIRAAHRALMKQFHPDAGGSNWLAAKINAAKDVLLGTHG